jgi:C-terminal processing protease CtpA/Prc
VEDFGIDIKEGNGFFWIEYVHKHSPAFNAKLQRDTKIIAINGQTLTGMTLEQVNGVLHKAEKEDKKITITIQGKNDKTTQNVMLPIEPYDSYGVQIRVYNKGRWARADLLLNPNEVITDEMKTYWIGVARKALDGLKEQALACRDS